MGKTTEKTNKENPDKGWHWEIATLGRWPCCVTWDVLESSEIPSERKEHKTMKTMGETTETALEK